MATFLTILLTIVIAIILIVILGLSGWGLQGLASFIVFCWEGVTGCVGCFVRSLIVLLIIAFIVAVLYAMIQ